MSLRFVICSGLTPCEQELYLFHCFLGKSNQMRIQTTKSSDNIGQILKAKHIGKAVFFSWRVFSVQRYY